jgi:hypothetical protein
MHNSKKKRLEAKGWKVGSTKEFLELSAEEEAYIEIKLKLAESFRERRLRCRMTQSDVAKAIKSSQSRVAKMEAGDRSVSMDLLVRSLLALGIPGKRFIQLLSKGLSV